METTAIVDALLELGPIGVLSVFLNAVGYYLKKTPIAGWAIPLVLISLGAVIFPFVAEEGTIVYNSRYPEILTGMVGGCIGAFAVATHQVASGFLNRNSKGRSDAQTIPDNAER